MSTNVCPVLRAYLEEVCTLDEVTPNSATLCDQYFGDLRSRLQKTQSTTTIERARIFTLIDHVVRCIAPIALDVTLQDLARDLRRLAPIQDDLAVVVAHAAMEKIENDALEDCVNDGCLGNWYRGLAYESAKIGSAVPAMEFQWLSKACKAESEATGAAYGAVYWARRTCQEWEASGFTLDSSHKLLRNLLEVMAKAQEAVDHYQRRRDLNQTEPESLKNRWAQWDQERSEETFKKRADRRAIAEAANEETIWAAARQALIAALEVTA